MLASSDEPYSVTPGFESKPVIYVSFWDALRFANWLHNGEPTGAQDVTTTEDGAYTITAQGIANNSITRDPWAKFFVTNEDEWFKAAFYDPLSASYFEYPAGTDPQRPSGGCGGATVARRPSSCHSPLCRPP